VRVISPRKLREFCRKHPDAVAPLDAWLKFIRNGNFRSPDDLRKTFNTVDVVPIRRPNKTIDYYVFNIGGNKYRLIAAIHFNTQLLYLRDILTHQEYDVGKWKK